jgi:beta-glucanase (GH16 family)
VPGYGIESFEDDADLVTVNDDGHLVVSAKRDPDGSWRGGMVSSRKSFKTKTGTIEFRAKLPTQQGAWPAIWLHNRIGAADEEAGSSRAEIDLMEVFPGGGENKENGAFFTAHDWTDGDKGTNLPPHEGAIDGGWHVWKLTWSASGMQLWIDGKSQGVLTPKEFNKASGGGDYSVFHTTDMYLILNMAVGTSWGGLEPRAETSRLDMLVDYVRVSPLTEGEADH